MRNIRITVTTLVTLMLLAIGGCGGEQSGSSLPSQSDLGESTPFHAEVKIGKVLLLPDYRTPDGNGAALTADASLEQLCGSVVKATFYGSSQKQHFVLHTPDNSLGYVKFPINCPPEAERPNDFEKTLKKPLAQLAAAVGNRDVWIVLNGTTSWLPGKAGPWFVGTYEQKGGAEPEEPTVAEANANCPPPDGADEAAIAACAEVDATDANEQTGGEGDAAAAETTDG